MVTAGKIGHTTVLNWNVTDIAEVTRIGGVNISVTKVDSTSLGIATYYKEIIPGLLDPGDIDIEGIFKPSDTNGQIALMTDMEARISRDFTITFPTVLATTWTGTAYVTKFSTGEVTSEGMLTFSATLSIVGQPSLNIDLSAGITGLEAKEFDETNIPYSPTVGVAVYTYIGDTIVDTITCVSVKLKVTSADDVITATCLGVVHVLTSPNWSEAIAIDVAGSVTPLYIHTKATGKSSRDYTLWINRA